MNILVIILLVTTLSPASNGLSDVFLRTNNDISVSLYQELMKSQTGNFVYGILPLDAIIALAYFGTKGDTAHQIKSAFGWNTSDDKLTNDFETAIKELENIRHCKIHLSNRIYASDRFDINPKFIEKASHFDTHIVKANFGLARETAENINSWAETRTNKKIKSWVEEHHFTPQTDLVLVNNLILHARWLHAFDDKSTQKMEFHLSKNETVEVDMMKVSGNFMASKHPTLGIKMVKLPYRNEKLYMVIIIADDIESIEFIGENARTFWNERNFTSQYMTVYLPKFQVTSTIDMIPTLKNMGITNLFSTADLGGISETATKVSVVTQKIYFDVDERGTSADHAPIDEIHAQKKEHKMNKEGEVLKVDHPFAFGILYENDLALIFGRVNTIQRNSL